MSVIEFPGADLPKRPFTDELHSQAFRDLEMSLRDCVKMSEIAAELMLNAIVDDRRLNFAVFHLAEMLTALEKEYDARWHGELRGSDDPECLQGLTPRQRQIIDEEVKRLTERGDEPA